MAKDTAAAPPTDPHGATHLRTARAHTPALAPFESIYRDLHAHPELSHQEQRTAGIAAAHLRTLPGFDVTERVGGFGVVGVLRNGAGPTVLLRADMDSLPVAEATGLPYASCVRARDADGRDVPVMAACGHDMHTTMLMAAASTLHAAQPAWSGTLIALFQPAEEFVAGARAMVDDGLYAPGRHGVPVPDVVLGQHVMSLRAGRVALSPGPVLTANDTLRVRVFGRGAHGTRPDLGVDPVLAAAHVVVRLQGVVAREVRPGALAVLTVGSVVAGDAANVIPDHADIKLTLRTYDAALHKRLLAAIYRVVRAECQASGCEKEPEISTLMQCPAAVNDDESSARVAASFRGALGDSVTPQVPDTGSEDVGVLASAVDRPLVFWLTGGVDPDLYDKHEREGTLAQLPSIHMSNYAPCIQPTMRTGVEALAVAALAFLHERN